jgi:uncharacterized protein YecA (UPF0149 family)
MLNDVKLFINSLSLTVSSNSKVFDIISTPKETSAIPANTKVGRNEPCPCGSGKKFKNCCGA